jgi:hypothetical protein
MDLHFLTTLINLPPPHAIKNQIVNLEMELITIVLSIWDKNIVD